MKTNTASNTNCTFPELPLTNHARRRMNARRLSDQTVMTVMLYGRLVRARGAEIYAIGRKEVDRYLAEEGIDLSGVEGVQVVCSPDGAILTVYRNNDFRRLRSRRGSSGRRDAA